MSNDAPQHLPFDIRCTSCRKGDDEKKGEIVGCSGCDGAWHQRCHKPYIRSEFKDQPDLPWYCKSCTKERDEEKQEEEEEEEEEEETIRVPDNTPCVVCRIRYGRGGNAILACRLCGRAWHQSCHEPRIPGTFAVRKTVPWYCKGCQQERNRQRQADRQTKRAHSASRGGNKKSETEVEGTQTEVAGKTATPRTSSKGKQTEVVKPTRGRSPARRTAQAEENAYGYYEVERLLDRRLRHDGNGKEQVEFLIKWKGYGDEENQWIPKEWVTEDLTSSHEQALEKQTPRQSQPPQTGQSTDEETVAEPSTPSRGRQRQRASPGTERSNASQGIQMDEPADTTGAAGFTNPETTPTEKQTRSASSKRVHFDIPPWDTDEPADTDVTAEAPNLSPIKPKAKARAPSTGSPGKSILKNQASNQAANDPEVVAEQQLDNDLWAAVDRAREAGLENWHIRAIGEGFFQGFYQHDSGSEEDVEEL